MRVLRARLRSWMVGVAIASVIALSGTGASADAPRITSFDLRARADTVGFSFVDPTLPLFDEIVLTPASAQATATSFGGSSSFAGAPYTGDLSTLLGTANGLAAGSLPLLPSYMPGYVISSFPQNPGPTTQEVATYLVSTGSTANGSTAEARLGVASDDPAAVAAIATADVSVSEDKSIASSEAWVGALRLGDLIGIGEVSASARVTVDSDGNVEKESSVEIGLLEIAGISIGLGPDGLKVGPKALGLIDLSVINQLLGQAGIEFEYMPAEETETSITSAGLEITITQDVPTQGRVVSTLTLGRVSASVNVRIPVSSPAVTPTPTTTLAAPSEQPTSDVAPTAHVPVTADAAPAAPGSAPTAPSEATSRSAMPASVQVRAIDLGADGVDFYLMMLLGFIAPIAASRLTAVLGVRARR